MVSYTESRHSAEFIISEAAGHRSRDNVVVPANTTVEVGEVLAGGIAIYGIVTGADPGAVAVIARDAEVNGHCLAWESGATVSAMEAIATTLAGKGIIVRGLPGAPDSP